MRTARSLLSLVLSALASTAAVGCATSEATDAYGDAADEASVPGSFDVWQSASGPHYFHLVAGNGRTLLTSEGYQTRTGALGGLLAVLEAGATAGGYQVVQGASGYHVRLVAANHETVAATEVYASKASATRAIGACVRAIGAYRAQQARATGARLELATGATGQVHFNVHAANGAVVLTSEAYTTRAAALNGAFAAQDSSDDLASYEVRQATSGGYYFVLRAANHEIVGTSQVYATKQAAQTGRDAVIALLPSIILI